MRGADHSSRRAVSIVLLRCVCSREFVNEEAVAHWVGCCAK